MFKTLLWLKEIRENEGLTHDKVADRAGISRAHYTNIEKGNRRPSIKVAKRLGTILGFEWTKFFEQDQKVG